MNNLNKSYKVTISNRLITHINHCHDSINLKHHTFKESMPSQSEMLSLNGDKYNIKQMKENTSIPVYRKMLNYTKRKPAPSTK